jgi:lipoprotein-anchoring transpeptidase ErfK/SrfK
MARLAYGVPLVGNDFAVIPAARPLVRHIPVIRPAELPEPEIDEQLLRSIDIESVVQTPDTFQARAKSKFFSVVRILFVGLLLIALATSGWMYTHPEKISGASQAQAAGAATAPASMAAAIVQQKIDLLVDGKAVSPSSTEINNWLSKDLTAPADKQLVVNQTAVKAYLKSLAGPFDKQMLNTITKPDGSDLIAGTAGQKLDTTAALTAITGNLLSGKGMNVNMPVVPVPVKTVAMDDMDKLLVANITSKTMVAYEHGKVVKNFLVSAGRSSAPTPTGQFHITRKFVKDDMSGFSPGGGHYFVANVKYVSYFDDALGAAIHANDWAPQTIFGHVNESLGCLGMTVADSHWVYDWAPVGTTLVNQK